MGAVCVCRSASDLDSGVCVRIRCKGGEDLSASTYAGLRATPVVASTYVGLEATIAARSGWIPMKSARAAACGVKYNEDEEKERRLRLR